MPGTLRNDNHSGDGGVGDWAKCVMMPGLYKIAERNLLCMYFRVRDEEWKSSST